MYIVTWWLKVETVEQEEGAIARQRRGKHIFAATNQHATTEELLEAVFSVWIAPRLCVCVCVCVTLD
jgi:hypothetical protein